MSFYFYKTAILMVHYGTTFENTRKETLEKINNEVKKEFPNFEIKEAYTSRKILKKLTDKGIFKNSPIDALEKLAKDKYTHIIIQPTNIINGSEKKILEEQIKLYENKFQEIKLGSVLLENQNDYKKVAEIINNEMGKIEKDEALLLIGHGTLNSKNISYTTMENVAKSMGYNFYVGTINGYPQIEDIIIKLKRDDVKKVILMPFMFVAGYHANKDINNKWKETLEKENFSVEVKLTSLGMINDIRKIFIEHIKSMIENL